MRDSAFRKGPTAAWPAADGPYGGPERGVDAAGASSARRAGTGGVRDGAAMARGEGGVRDGCVRDGARPAEDCLDRPRAG
ncbi:hypothetical protein JCM4914_52220 [Streptomyces platensis subsp. malvinus]